jgi:uncharacterized protein with NRDE domain
MCTVSFVRSGDKIILTSNRDEEVLRPAIAPRNYCVNNKNIVFPKDPRAGGTWFAVAENANVLVLLNGAAEKHQWNPPYRKSRGLVVLDLIGADSPIESWTTVDLDGIEPFTLVLYEKAELFQLRWDGSQKETVKLDTNRNYVWSSSTLYPKDVREQRSEWFYRFLDTRPNANEAEMFNFHRYTENEDEQYGLVINRGDKLKTLSITQAVIEKNKVAVVHHDLLDHQQSEQTFTIV